MGFLSLTSRHVFWCRGLLFFFPNTEYRLRFLLLHELNAEEGIFKAYFRKMLTLDWFYWRWTRRSTFVLSWSCQLNRSQLEWILNLASLRICPVEDGFLSLTGCCFTLWCEVHANVPVLQEWKEGRCWLFGTGAGKLNTWKKIGSVGLLNLLSLDYVSMVPLALRHSWECSSWYCSKYNQQLTGDANCVVYR